MKLLHLLNRVIKNPSLIVYHSLSRIRIFWYNLNPNIKIGKGCIIEKGVSIRTIGGGKIVVGNNCQLYMNAFLLTWGGDIIIGDNCGINAFTTIYGQGGVRIGNNVMIASNSTIIPANHSFDEVEVPMIQQSQTKRGINIEDDVWIGTGVRVLDGVTIRTGSVVGAGTVLTKSTEPYGVYVGVPGKKIKSRLRE